MLDFLRLKSAEIMALPKPDSDINYSSNERVVKLSGMLKGAQVDSLETSKIAEALEVLTQQQALIGGLQLAHIDAVKVAAALTEAVKLAQDGAIDVSDVFNHARSALALGTVKLSSADDLFDQSPGEIIQGSEPEKKAAQQPSQQPDVLTQTIRTIRESA